MPDECREIELNQDFQVRSRITIVGRMTDAERSPKGRKLKG